MHAFNWMPLLYKWIRKKVTIILPHSIYIGLFNTATRDTVKGCSIGEECGYQTVLHLLMLYWFSQFKRTGRLNGLVKTGH